MSRCCGRIALDETEFVTISYWETVEAMSRYAGKDPRRIRHLERDAEFLTELPKNVQILEIVASLSSNRANNPLQELREWEGSARRAISRDEGWPFLGGLSAER